MDLCIADDACNKLDAFYENKRQSPTQDEITNASNDLFTNAFVVCIDYQIDQLEPNPESEHSTARTVDAETQQWDADREQSSDESWPMSDIQDEQEVKSRKRR